MVTLHCSGLIWGPWADCWRENHSWEWESTSWSDKKNSSWCENGSIRAAINSLGPTSCPPGLGLLYLPLRLILLQHIKMCSWWALRSPGCVRECSPGGHLNKEWVYSTPSAEAQLLMLFFLGREQNIVRRSGFFLQANRRVSLTTQLYSWHVSSTIHCPVACNNKGPFSSTSVCETTEHTFSHAEPRCTQTDDHSGGWAADSTILRLLPTFVSLTIRLQADREHGSATELRDFVKCVAHQNARAAPAEVSHPLLTMALLAPPVTCELGNERRGGAVIYITNVRVRRTWTPPSPRASSASLIRWGCIIHQTASKWRKDIHHCPPFKLDPTDVAIIQMHQYSVLAESSPAETSPPLQLYKPYFSVTTALVA